MEIRYCLPNTNLRRGQKIMVDLSPGEVILACDACTYSNQTSFRLTFEDWTSWKVVNGSNWRKVSVKPWSDYRPVTGVVRTSTSNSQVKTWYRQPQSRRSRSVLSANFRLTCVKWEIRERSSRTLWIGADTNVLSRNQMKTSLPVIVRFDLVLTFWTLAVEQRKMVA